MNRITRKDAGILGLALLALTQALALGLRRTSRPEASGTWLQAGDDIGGLHAVAESGRVSSFAGGSTTVVLVFDSRCGHCRRVAPEWKAWIEEAPAALAVVGVSAEAPDSANAFAGEMGWGVEILRVDGPSGSPEHALTGRTPWVFVLDGEGRIQAEGIGTRIVELTGSVLAGALGASPP